MWQLNCPQVYAQASENIIGSTSPHVNIEQIKNFRLALPPLEEQRQIVAAISLEIGSIDRLTARLEQGILLFREYRARLIADVVTGKLDVRAAAAQLPDEEREQQNPVLSDGLESIEEETTFAETAND